MNNVAVVTLFKDNFGSILQAYSTRSYVVSLGNNCDFLQPILDTSPWSKLKKVPAIIWRCLYYRGYYSDRRRAKTAFHQDSNLLSTKTKAEMEKFCDTNFSIVDVHTQELSALNNKYDYFITGSDQVWNGYDGFRYLVFADYNKRIAFAPSFGTGEVKNYFKKNVKNALNGFEVLSVREESGVKIINDLTGRKAIRLADPTLLLSKQQWEQFAEKGLQQRNYILLHFLNAPNALAIKKINDYLLEHSCAAYCICNQYKEYEQLIRHNFLDINPYDYVSLIHRADFVFTDSFHSTLFSLNLETNFIAFERQYLHGNSQSSRVIDLLKRVGMLDRFVADDIEINYDNKINWCSDKLFHDERVMQKEYLKNMLER